MKFWRNADPVYIVGNHGGRYKFEYLHFSYTSKSISMKARLCQCDVLARRNWVMISI